MRLLAFAFAISLVGCCGKQQYRQPIYPPPIYLPPPPTIMPPPVLIQPQPAFFPAQPAYFPPETLCPPPCKPKVEKCFKMIVSENYPYDRGPDFRWEMSWKW